MLLITVSLEDRSHSAPRKTPDDDTNSHVQMQKEVADLEAGQNESSLPSFPTLVRVKAEIRASRDFVVFDHSFQKPRRALFPFRVTDTRPHFPIAKFTNSLKPKVLPPPM